LSPRKFLGQARVICFELAAHTLKMPGKSPGFLQL
jgi:hypothetical protein